MSHKLVFDIDEILPTVEDVEKFAVVFNNRDELVEVVSKTGTETYEKDWAAYEAVCKSFGIDPDTLYTSIFMTRVFDVAKHSVELAVDVVDGAENTSAITEQSDFDDSGQGDTNVPE